MKLELKDQVTSLEWSKNLKELGVKQDSLFYWIINRRDTQDLPQLVNQNYDLPITNDIFEYFSAFTSAEVAAMLPSYVRVDGDKKLLFTSKNRMNQGLYDNYECEYHPISCHDVNEANVRAKMLIHLTERGYKGESIFSISMEDAIG